MQNDEREQRDDRDERAGTEPEEAWPRDEQLPDDGAPADASAEIEDAVDAAEADEFETASWPAQDTTARVIEPASEPPSEVEAYEALGREPADPVAVTPDAVSADAVSADVAPDMAAPDAVAPEPPPSDVEAHAPTLAAEPAAAPVAAHSVPATEPGESTKCPRCGTENRPGISFCRNCGQRLVAAGAPTTVERPAAPEGTQQCSRCGTHNRAGVAFCQNCGANLRTAAEGYVPPAVASDSPVVAADEPAGRAFLGPVVLLVGALFLGIAWALPFAGDTSLFQRAFGADGYGVAFWNGYEGLDGLAAQAYFGFAAPVPLLILLLVGLAIAGMLRRVPGPLQLIGLVAALAWAIGLVVLFVIVEVLGAGTGDLLGILRVLTPGGIIFMLASLIVVIGSLTRLGRG